MDLQGLMCRRPLHCFALPLFANAPLLFAVSRVLQAMDLQGLMKELAFAWYGPHLKGEFTLVCGKGLCVASSCLQHLCGVCLSFPSSRRRTVQGSVQQTSGFTVCQVSFWPVIALLSLLTLREITLRPCPCPCLPRQVRSLRVGVLLGHAHVQALPPTALPLLTFRSPSQPCPS